MEATIVINGQRLDSAQSATLRVAVTSFRMEVADPKTAHLLGPIAGAYKARLDEIIGIIMRTAK